LIRLPRGVLPVIAMVGIWKAGAAWALVEDTYAPERIDFIRKDCSCKCDICMDNWDEIMRTPALSGYEEYDPHDAAYAIYTSGTTGNPKGVLHERGNLERAIDSIRIDGECPFNEKDRLATLAPMNFVATVIVVLCALNVFKGKNFIVSYATIKNTTALAKFFLTKRITITFLTPSYARMLGNQTGPFLRMFFVGSEPANNLYMKNVKLINIYAASESGFAVGFFEIDKPYPACPIGYPRVETKIYLKGEDGNDVREGEMGELCFENPYVRGYINLPEETANAFRDGIYHTGDLARYDENGNLILLGRSGDMIKINGNRIEPAEIEAAMKQVLGIDWCAARGFEEDGKSFLCAYYKDDIKIDTDYLRQELMKRLPHYMIPAYYMKIDEIPLKATGKLDRRALPMPNMEDFKSDYVAPETETQKILCESFAKVLGLSKVGIKDDFYEMGGDSLASIDLITEAGLKGLNAAQVFHGRTPEKIAEIYEKEREAKGDEDPDELNAEALKVPHPLTTEQLYMIDYQLTTPSSTMYNLFSMLRLDKELFDMERMAEALEKAIANHPSLLTTVYWNEDGVCEQKYTPEIAQKIHVERMSEFEFKFVKDSMVYPFKIIGGKLYRCRVFETEKAGYVFFDVHHTVFDGTSLKVFMSDVVKIYMGMEPDKDYYYLMLKRREDAIKTPLYEESRKYFESRFEGIEWSTYPKPDKASGENEMGELKAELGIEQAQMRAIEKGYKVSRNEFFISVAALTISIFNKKKNIKMSWIYNGREDSELLTTVGLLFRDLPIGIRFNDKAKLRDLLSDIHDQVQKGIEHSCYPYVEADAQAMEHEAAYLLYQQDIRDMGGSDGFDIETIDIRQNQAASQAILDIQILDGAEGLQIVLDYAAGLYKDATIDKFKDLYIRVAQSMITHNPMQDITIGELKKKIADKKGFFKKVKGIFSRKR
nr:AMP-binding protein [Saccharofermentans sp.]